MKSFKFMPNVMFRLKLHECLLECLFDSVPFKLERKEEFNSECVIKSVRLCEIVVIHDVEKTKFHDDVKILLYVIKKLTSVVKFCLNRKKIVSTEFRTLERKNNRCNGNLSVE